MDITPPTHLLWLDLETTGSDPLDPYAVILEIGAVVTLWDPQLTEVARAQMLVRPTGSPTDHATIWANTLPVIKEMHTVNGLWREATMSEDAWSIDEADVAVSRWLTTHVGDAAVPVAGSGVGHLDFPFVKRHLPRVAARLTYWPLDIGNIRRAIQLAGRTDLVDLERDVVAKPHRGLADALLHVAEARVQLAQLASIPVPGQQAPPVPA